jgi:Rad3-related DNA helicase
MLPGLNRVMQAAGRVIRTEYDKGFVLLLDDRFLHKRYIDQFPKNGSTIPGWFLQNRYPHIVRILE